MSTTPITGTLTRAGTFPIRDEETTGLVISMTEAELFAVPSLPMYQRVCVVPAEPCRWTHRALGMHATSCDQYYAKHSTYDFCPGCGRKIELVKTEEKT